MEFTDSTLYQEYALIQQAAIKAYSRYETIIVTDVGEYPVTSTISIDRVRDYRGASGDETIVTLAVPWGMYLKRIVPFKENLKVIIIKHTTISSSPDNTGAPIEQTFIGHLLPEQETDTMNNRPETESEAVSNMMALKQFRVQLEEEAYSLSRSEMVGGVFNDSKPYDVLMALLNTSIKNMELDEVNKIKGISAIPPNNDVKRTHIVLPHGVPLVSVANKLQTQYGGIYNTGVGCYLQKDYWYVWPLYNYKLYDTATRTGMFVLIPGNKYAGVEHTYRMVGENFAAIITGGFSRLDPSEALLLNEGGSARYANTDTMIDSFVKVEGNKALAQRHANASEYNAVPRKGEKMSRVNDDMAHSNAFNEASKIAERNAAYITMNWENGNADLITPGLQVELAFLADNQEQFINGVVIHAHEYSAIVGTGVTQLLHQNIISLVVMVDRHSPEYQKFLDENPDPQQ